MNKELIRKCEHCGRYYYATMPHFMKAGNHCDGLEKIENDFRTLNNIPTWEVWHLSISTIDYMISFDYDQEASVRNFMRLVGKKLELI